MYGRKNGWFRNACFTFDGKVIDLGRRITLYRSLWDDMTQAELANKAGISVGYLSQIEQNKVSPAEKTIDKIAKAFGVTRNELLGV